MSQQAILEQGIKDANLDISAQTQQRLLDYLVLMQSGLTTTVYQVHTVYLKMLKSLV
jgi:hypothetical protein